MCLGSCPPILRYNLIVPLTTRSLICMSNIKLSCNFHALAYEIILNSWNLYIKRYFLRHIDNKNTYYQHGNKITGITSIMTPLKRTCRNHYLHSRYTLTVTVTEIMPRVICCKKLLWIPRNGYQCCFI